MKADLSILDKPLAELPAPEGFATTAIQMGFLTLHDIIKTGVPSLIRTKGFNYHWCYELFQLLDEHGLLTMLDKA